MIDRICASAATAATALLLTAVAASAATLDFTFSFTNLLNGGGTVTGIVRGLTDNTTGTAASVDILSNSDLFGTGEYVGAELENSFTVAGGVLTSLQFNSFGSANTAPQVTCCSLWLSLNIGIAAAGLTNSPSSVIFGVTDLTFQRVAEPEALPLPAALPLLLAALGGLGFAARRRA